MPGDKYRASFELVLRTTMHAALVDLNRLIALLQEHAPDLLPLYYRTDKTACEGISKLKDRG